MIAMLNMFKASASAKEAEVIDNFVQKFVVVSNDGMMSRIEADSADLIKFFIEHNFVITNFIHSRNKVPATEFNLETLRKISQENKIKPLSADVINNIQNQCLVAAKNGETSIKVVLGTAANTENLKLAFPGFTINCTGTAAYIIQWD